MNPFDPLDVHGQARKKAKAERHARFVSQRDRDDFKWLMGDGRGRRVMYRLLERTGVFRSSFTGNSETFFLEGQRNVGLMLMAQIHEACPEQYTAMLKEQKDDAGHDDDGPADNDH